jgi:predicted cupin superfamily sugar epimerase
MKHYRKNSRINIYMKAEELITHFMMLPHPEGGWYKENYRSNEIFPGTALPERFGGNREFATAIYFLLEQGNYSAFHRLKSDECWHFYDGDPLEIFIIREDGRFDKITLGRDFGNNQYYQFVVPANCWFASRPAPGSAFSFVGCTVSPGFDFADFEIADADMLAVNYPQYEKLIRSFSLANKQESE